MVLQAPTRPKSRTVVGLVAFSLFVDYLLYGTVMPLMPHSPAKVGEEQLGCYRTAPPGASGPLRRNAQGSGSHVHSGSHYLRRLFAGYAGHDRVNLHSGSPPGFWGHSAGR